MFALKLELGFIEISDIQFSKECKVENGTLFVNPDEVKAFVFQDDDVKACLKDACFDIAKPGESVRITPVKDVIEPRVKVEGPGGEFPGVIAKVDTVGSGKTHVLRGMAVVTAGKIVGFQEGIIDMSGPGAEYTPFSKLLNLVMVCEPVDGLKQHEYEHAVRIAGLKAATFLGELGRNVSPMRPRSSRPTASRRAWRSIPTCPGWAMSTCSRARACSTTPMSTAWMPSAPCPPSSTPPRPWTAPSLSGNCVSACDKNTTYHHQNNPVVADLFEQHGKTPELYVCNIITNENVYLADKQRSSDWTAKLCRLLDLDGVIVSQEGFGNPDTDLIMNTKKIELQGVKTTIITDEYAGQDGKSQSLADADPLADAVVTGGNANEVIILPKMDKVIGMLDYVDIIAGGHAGSLRPDGTIEAELQVITGATNEMGFNRLSAR